MAYILALAGALAGVFATLVITEDRAGSLGWDYASKVVPGNDSLAPASEVLARLADTARDTESNAARFRADPDRPADRNILDLIVGKPDANQAEWLRTGYPQFGPGTTAAVVPFTAAETADLSGDYVFQGDAQAVDRLTAVFHDAGYLTSTVTLADAPAFLAWFLSQPMAPGLIGLALLSVLLTVIAVLSSVRRYAIGRLHGAHPLRLLRRDLGDVFWGFWPGWVLVTLGASALIIGGNGGAHLPLYLTVAGQTLLVVFLLLVLCHTIALLTTLRIPIHRALTGRSLARGSLPLLLTLRVPALIFAVILVFPLVQARSDLREYDAAIAEWAKYPSATFLNLRGAQNPNEVDAALPPLGALIREADERGTIILAGPHFLPTESGEREVLRVNPAFLLTQPLTGTDGAPVRVETDQSTLLIPSSQWAERGSLIAAAVDDARGQQTLDPLDGPQHAGASEIVAIQTLDAQSVFTFPITPSPQSPAHLDDPIVLVTPLKTTPLTDFTLASLASQGDVIVMDSQDLRTRIDGAGLGNLIRSYAPAAESALVDRDRSARDVTGATLGVLSALVVLIAAAFGTAEFTTRSRSTELFVRFTAGQRFTHRFRSILIWETALSGTALAALLAGIALRSAFTAPGQPLESPLPLLGAGIGMIALSSAVLIAGLHLFPTRTRRTGGHSD
ncbi:hypothetical protein D9V32_10855 [Mycetocola tolaasinivorans]|uniref:ABC transporter permease n=1 Tax=Mycetocola tolaasinivorans TaxID=76635 RepID=A0A3L7A403_9MICO|nr:hypothetical protein D9V32_10855 [Mycetocola tolaasinivorans]